MLGASEAASDSDDAVFEMVESIGLVLTVGGMILAATAGIGGALKTAVGIRKKSRLTGTALILAIVIVVGLVILILLR